MKTIAVKFNREDIAVCERKLFGFELNLLESVLVPVKIFQFPDRSFSRHFSRSRPMAYWQAGRQE